MREHVNKNHKDLIFYYSFFFLKVFFFFYLFQNLLLNLR